MKIQLHNSTGLPELGTIPYIIGSLEPLKPPYKEEVILPKVQEEYGFGLHELSNGTITATGTYETIGDIPLEPIATYTLGSFVVYQYHYGILAFMFDKPFITRMD